ncbi:hypothetical protein GCM10023169_19980 [Georgenia halophila]|uniref:Lipoprotein signal peptidase n=1 Tax=Georgenia halophila TaxID=620889 RepID=A0ABP8L7Y6_9MICO
MDSQPSPPPLRRRDLRRRGAPPDDAPRTDVPAAGEPGEPNGQYSSSGTASVTPTEVTAAEDTEDAADSPVPVDPARRRRLLALLLSLTVVLAGTDQLTKYIAEARLEDGEVVPLIGDLLGLQLVHNAGAAFSIATGMTWVFTIVMVVVAVAVLRVSRKLGSVGWAVALGMLLGGCLGNLYDRLFREPDFARGHVVDFINYNGWFVGNVADIAIVGAAGLIIVLALRGREIDGSIERPEPRDRAEARDEPGEEPDDRG